MTDESVKPHAEPAQAGAGKIGGVDKRVVAGVAGIAVGSAAIAAALMFTTRYKQGKPVVPPPPEPKVPNRPKVPDASDIKIGE